MTTARGLINHNPGNVRHGAPWRGLDQDQPDPSFCRFVEPIYGLRAIAAILANYRRRHGIATLRDLAARWAPPVENDTASYLRTLCMVSGYEPHEEIDLRSPEVLARIIPGIVRQECGACPFVAVEIEDAIALAAVQDAPRSVDPDDQAPQVPLDPIGRPRALPGSPAAHLRRSPHDA